MKLVSPDLLIPLRNRLKSSLASGFGSESQIALECLALLDAAMSHADRMAAAERELLGAALAFTERQPSAEAAGAVSVRMGDAAAAVRSLRQSPGTTDADAFYGVYPCTVVKDRYVGTYSRGKWQAWHCGPETVPSAANESDGIADDFWMELRAGANLTDAGPRPEVGLGDTPGEAVAALELAVKARDRRTA